MKKKFSLFLIALLAILTLPAQAQFRIGVKGGANISSIHFSDPVENFNASNMTGFYIGPMVELMAPVIGLGFDAAVLYSQKGMEAYGETFRTDYLDVPVNLKWKFGLPILKVYLTAGPYIGFKLGNSYSFDTFIDNLGSVGDQFKTKSFSAGLNFGAGVEVIKHLQVGLNYGLGLTDNYSIDKLNMNGKNRGWSISAAILF